MEQSQIEKINRSVNHYKWLDKHLDEFWIKVFGKNLSDTWNGGIVTAHGDKGRGYQRNWAENGISFPHGMALFLLTYTNVMDDEKHKSCEWVITNYPKYKDMLPEVDLTDNDILRTF